MQELSKNELKSISGGWAHLLARAIIAVGSAIIDAIKNPDDFMEGYSAARNGFYEPEIEN